MGHSRLGSWVGALAAVAALAGCLGAVVWSLVSDLPAYLVNPDGTATLPEVGQQQIIGSDAVYVLIGLVLGLAIGALTWIWFQSVGWPCAVIATAAGVLAGLVCWGVGELLGPGPFDARLAAARPGDLVPVALQLRSPSALAVWAFAAVAPTLFVSSLGPEVASPEAPARELAPEAGDAGGASSATMVDHGGAGAGGAGASRAAG